MVLLDFAFLRHWNWILTLIPLTWIIRWAPTNASRWQMGFNSAFKRLIFRCFPVQVKAIKGHYPSISPSIRFTWTNSIKHIHYLEGKGKGNWTLVQALSLCTCRMANRGSRGIVLLFLDHGTSREWGVSVTPRPLFTHGKDPVPILQEAGWAQGRSGQVRKNLAPTRIRSPDCPARSSVAIPTELLGRPFFRR